MCITLLKKVDKLWVRWGQAVNPHFPGIKTKNQG